MEKVAPIQIHYPRVKQPAGEKLLFNTGSPVWCPEMTQRGGVREGEEGTGGREQVSLVAKTVKKQPAMKQTQVQFLGQEDPLEQGMAPHSSILAWRIPRTEEPGGLSLWGHKESDMNEQLTFSHG